MNRNVNSVAPLALLALLASVGCQSEVVEDAFSSEFRVKFGSVAEPGEYPWMAQILDLDSSGSNHRCGGSLVAPQWVLTAAHCVDSADLSSRRIVLGEHDRETEEGTEQVFEIAEVLIPEGYLSVIHADIALVRLDRCAELGPNVQLIRLAETDPAIGTETVLTGWGYTEPGPEDDIYGPQSRYLKESVTYVVEPNDGTPELDGDTCVEYLALESSTEVNENHYCTLYEGDTTSGCFTDSGGPVVVYDEAGNPRQVALHVSGDLLCMAYNVSTKIPLYIDWIREHLPELPEDAVYEAEEMHHQTGGEHPGGWNIWDNGYISFLHTFDGGSQEMVVRAAGQNGNGWPNMQITVGGQFVYNTNVVGEDWDDYAFSFNAPVGEAEVRVAFTNDHYQPPADRNLFIDNVTVLGPAPTCDLPDAPMEASFVAGNDWGSGYCMTISVTNHATTPTTNWSASFDLQDGTLYTSWGGTFSSNTGVVSVTPIIENTRTLDPDETNTELGFCVNRGPSGFKPALDAIEATGQY